MRIRRKGRRNTIVLARSPVTGHHTTVLRLLAIVAALSTLLALTGLLELTHCSDGHHDDEHQPNACVCICHAGVAVLPDAPVVQTSAPTMRLALEADDARRPLDVRIAIDPPPDKRGA